MHPATLLVWPAGLYYYLLTKGGKPYQAFGWIYVVLFTLFAIWNAKAYFLSPAYPILFAAGALLVERFIRWREWHWLKPVSVSFAGAAPRCFSKDHRAYWRERRVGVRGPRSGGDTAAIRL